MTKSLKRFLASSSLGCSEKNRTGPVFAVLTKEETHHLRDVLRMKEGATLVLFDGEGNEYIARLGRFRKDGSSEAQLVERLGSDQDAGVKLSVAQAIPQA